MDVSPSFHMEGRQRASTSPRGSPSLTPLKAPRKFTEPGTPGQTPSRARSSTQDRLLQLKSDGAYSPKRNGRIFQPEPRTWLGTLRKTAHDTVEKRWARASEAYPMIVGHVEFLIGGLEFAIRSLFWFRFGIVAVWLGFRLIVYSIMLLPAFLQIVAAYYHDRRILRSVRFGPNSRNYVDIYCPNEAVLAQQGKGGKVPVVIAVMGGAWVMGHRAWNAQLGLRLMDFGVIVFAVDYRNFPFGHVPEMVEDIGRAVGWVFENCEAYGGDSSNVMLLAQSAGAHLAALLLLERSILEAKEGFSAKNEGEEAEDEDDSMHLDRAWSVSKLKAFMGVSGPYDLVALEPHLASRGIYPRILYSLAVDGDLTGCSPTQVLSTEDWEENKASAVDLLPPIYLFHGEADKSVPSWSSLDFARALEASGVTRLTVDVRKGMTHTFPVIEGPMEGKDPQVEIALPFLVGKEKAEEALSAKQRGRMWPQIFLDLAKHIMPY